MVILKSISVHHKRETNGNYCILLQKVPPQNQPCLIFEAGTIVSLGPVEAENVRRTGGYKKLLDGYACLGQLQYVHEGSRELDFLLIITGCLSNGKLFHQHEILVISEVTIISMRNCADDLQHVKGLKQFLDSGCFYFSHPLSPGSIPFDLTLPAQRAFMNAKTDNRFFWNRLLFTNFERFGIDTSQWLVKTLCGCADVVTIYRGRTRAKACLFSRLSCERAGTRFHVRGVNDLGHVANFVESEVAIYYENEVTSFVIIRGSIPLFWEQPGVQVGSHRIRMSRGSEISQAAYDKHMLSLKERFENVVLINLLSSRESELHLNQLFNLHHKASRIGAEFPFINFDYHALAPHNNRENLDKFFSLELEKFCNQFGFFHSIDGKIVQVQRGSFRVNCLDCLDRTNLMQKYISRQMVEIMISHITFEIDHEKAIERYNDTFDICWQFAGNKLSKIYTGTGALDGKNILKDGALSVARTIQNNLLDDGKQNAIDILILGKILNRDYSYRAASLLPPYFMFASPNILVSMCDRYLDYCSPQELRVAVATWNVNGGKHFENSTYSRARPLSDWLVDYRTCVESDNTLISCTSEEPNAPIDIYAIGFQEIVDLNASNIVAASTKNQRDWLVEIQKAISKDHQYLIVTSSQLVGVCLFVFIRADLAPHIKDVCSDQVKTGLMGATGNKGGVAVRLRYKATSLCFICAHFAAGQHQVKERNDDYSEITRRIQFPMGRSINSHDYVFWCGDFNYRLDGISNEEVRQASSEGSYEFLLSHDQLRISQNAGLTFKNYIEGDIKFAPTYKYDAFSQDYDSSEKCRIPAYTDRILMKKRHQTYPEEELTNPNQIKFYNRVELLSSDHRPVIAEFEIQILEVNKKARNEVFDSVLKDCGPPDATIFVRVEGANMSDDHVLAEVVRILTDRAGEVVLIRFIKSIIMVIFKNGKDAVKATELDGHTLGDRFPNSRLRVSLKTHDWMDVIRSELKNHLYNTTNLVSGNGPNVHLEDDEDEIAQGLNMSIGPEVNPESICLGNEVFLSPPSEEGRALSPSPQPPPLPPKSPLKVPSRPPPPIPTSKQGPLPPIPPKSPAVIMPETSISHCLQPLTPVSYPNPVAEKSNSKTGAHDQSSVDLLEFSAMSLDVDESMLPPPPTMAPPAPPPDSPTKAPALIPSSMSSGHQLTKPNRAAPPPPIPMRNQRSDQDSPEAHYI